MSDMLGETKDFLPYPGRDLGNHTKKMNRGVGEVVWRERDELIFECHQHVGERQLTMLE